MMDRIDELVRSHEHLRAAVQDQAVVLARIETELTMGGTERDRRLAVLERKCRNGGWADPRFWTTAIIAVGALIAAIKLMWGG